MKNLPFKFLDYFNSPAHPLTLPVSCLFCLSEIRSTLLPAPCCFVIWERIFLSHSYRFYLANSCCP